MIAAAQSHVSPAPDAAAASFQRSARAKAEEFEAVFLTLFIDQMYSGIETDGPFGGGSAEKTYRSLLTQEYGTNIARSGGVGIADAVYREILKTQEVSQQ